MYEAKAKEEVSRNASEGVEPRNNSCSTKAKDFIFWKPEKTCAKRRANGNVPGSESAAGDRTVDAGTWESQSASERSRQQAEQRQEAGKPDWQSD